ncbi:MAG TPA: MBOAT family protein [Deltaproteobacteria bacterium]|jgi:alginate O-acetyltransferase complex protein AlgI|nr:MBOAT family protein [Deltaproteobacteria bacterium]
MLFNSFSYILVFLPAAAAGYYLLGRWNHMLSRYLLVAVSLLFFICGGLHSLPHLLASIGVNYVLGRGILRYGDNRVRKGLLVAGIVFNVLFLGVFKYADFFIENVSLLIHSGIAPLGLVMPLAISFYTFQQIAYLVDCYRGDAVKSSFLDYCLFVTFFPKLLAGPILRQRELLPQFGPAYRVKVDYRNLCIGLAIFSLGLVKRVVFADTFGLWADAGFKAGATHTFVEAWISSLSYTFQIYFDFSGYTDMAIGSAYFFNIRLPINFDSPYKALTIQDFWRRWHITLSRFLRDYIYIPLGGNRRGEARAYSNILITFLIGGIWHGAGWTFFLWGALHGTASVVQRIWHRLGLRLPKFLAWFITFNFINLAWVFFRAENLRDALEIIKAMFGFTVFSGGVLFEHISGKQQNFTWLILAVSIATVFFMKNTNSIPERFQPTGWRLAYQVVVILTGLLFLNSMMPSEFIYFDF